MLLVIFFSLSDFANNYESSSICCFCLFGWLSILKHTGWLSGTEHRREITVSNECVVCWRRSSCCSIETFCVVRVWTRNKNGKTDTRAEKHKGNEKKEEKRETEIKNQIKRKFGINPINEVDYCALPLPIHMLLAATGGAAAAAAPGWPGPGPNMSANGLPNCSRSSEALACAGCADPPNKSTMFPELVGDDKNGLFTAAAPDVGDATFV